MKLLVPRSKKISLSEILTLEETQELLKVYSLNTLKKKAQLGEIPCHWMKKDSDPRKRRGLFFIESELLDWLGLSEKRSA